MSRLISILLTVVLFLGFCSSTYGQLLISKPLDDFETGPFNEFTPVSWVQTGLPIANCWAGHRIVTVNNDPLATAELQLDTQSDNGIEVWFSTGPGIQQTALTLKYQFGEFTRDFTGGGAYDRIRVQCEEVKAVDFVIQVGIKTSTYSEVVWQGWSWFGEVPTLPKKDREFTFFLEHFAPAGNPKYVEEFYVRILTEPFNSGSFKVTHVELRGPLVLGQVDPPDDPIVPNPDRYFEEWHFEIGPGPGWSESIQVDLLERRLGQRRAARGHNRMGGEYPGRLVRADNSQSVPTGKGSISAVQLERDRLRPYSDGEFEFRFRLKDGKKSFAPGGSAKRLGNKAALLEVESHHTDPKTGSRSPIVHNMRLSIPEDTPLKFETVAGESNGDSFHIKFRVVRDGRKNTAKGPVFTMSHSAGAAPVAKAEGAEN